MIGGEFVSLPRQQLEPEQQLALAVQCPPQQLCLLYQGADTAVLAIAEALSCRATQLQFAWQQVHSSQLILIALSDTVPVLFNCQTQSVAEWLDALLRYALSQRASDIHCEPTTLGLRLRLRLAGQLVTLQHLSPEHGRQLIARAKVIADLDISEQRQPQDGRFSIALNDQHTQDFRISTCPMLHGEKLVIRCLGTLQQVTALSQLGMTDAQRQQVTRALTLKQGLILVTGPTGSGKTSTLYSLLQRLNQRVLNICTVEDPVEIRCDGINQVPVQSRRQLTFARILRSLLRQDPDVLMIGEIRDAETAQVALQAAQTGHLVLASLHTNGALESLQRLQALGVSSNDVGTALSLIISQRLLRRLCQHCGGRACSQCHDGYFGQLAVFEVVPWSSSSHQHLVQTGSIRDYLSQQQLPTLQQHAQACVEARLTSAQQAERLQNVSL